MKTIHPDKKKIAIIGCGGWAEKICLHLSNSKYFEVKAIICKNIQRYEKFKNFQIFKNLEDLVDKSKIDGFYIAGNPDMNLLMIKNIAKYSSKTPFILEKPISIENSDAEIIFSICKKNKLSFLLNQSNLHDPLYVYSKKIIRKKGDIKNIKIIEGGYGPFRNNINPILDWGIHSVSTFIDLTTSNIRIDSEKTLKKNGKGGLVKKIYLKSDHNIEGKIITGNLIKNKTRLIQVSFKEDSDIIKIDLIKREITINNSFITLPPTVINKTSFDNLFEIFYKKISLKRIEKFYNKIFQISLESQKIINKIILQN
jgi:hypothetical protein